VVYITRHGMRLDWAEPNWHLASGDDPCDPPLSEEGLQQARELGEHLAGVGPLDYIFSSPFLRCVQTADAVAAAQEKRDAQRLHSPKIFIEHALGEWDNSRRLNARTLPELKRLFPRVDANYASFIQLAPEDDDDHLGRQGHAKGESVHHLHLRCERFVEFINGNAVFGASGKRILFVGHAASSSALYRAWLSDHAAPFSIATCSLSQLVLEAGDSEEDEVSLEEGQLTEKKKTRRSMKWKVELCADCSHLSGGEQRPWGFPNLQNSPAQAKSKDGDDCNAVL